MTQLDETTAAPAAPSIGRERDHHRCSTRFVSVSVGPIALSVERRAIGVTIVLVVAVVGLAAWSMTLGDYGLSVADVVRSIFGTSGDALADYFVREARLPRTVAAIGVGLAFGASGALVQSVSNNPLGSPDIMGFTTGSATGAIILITAFNAAPSQVSVGAVVGGLATAAVVTALANQRGVTSGRLVLVGVGVGAVLQSVNTLLIVRAELTSAQNASMWLAGSLNAMTWSRCVLLVAPALALLIAAALLVRPLQAMMLGDGIAVGLGVRTDRTRVLAVLVAVGLVSVAVAASGPVGFVALAAPQLARRLTRTDGVGLASSAAMGAGIVLGADVVAAHAVAPTQLPVGVITGTLGGLYLIWLLIWQWRRNS